jgi:two-component system, LytTR family, sensor histidine kinase AgrC
MIELFSIHGPFPTELFSTAGALFIINNLFRIYVAYRFIGVFFDRYGIDKRREMLAYLGYFFLNSFMYLAFNILFLTMLTNILSIFAITFLYKSRLSTKALVTLLIYAPALCVEILVFVFLLAVDFEGNMTNLVLIIGSLILLLVVMMIERVKATSLDHEIKSKSWVALMFIPVASVFISLVLGMPLESFNWIVVALLFLLSINFIAFYLYDALGRYYVEENEKQLLIQQNEAYSRQFELIQQSQQSIQMLRHDMKNHMMTLSSLMTMGDRQELFEYMKKINANIETDTIHVDTGNHFVDSILNFKIEEAIRVGAQVKVDIHIPDKLNIQAFDLNVIIGNLMDNAIEGSKEVEDKQIHFDMILDRSMLFIKVQNHYNGNLKRKKGEFLSTKGNEKLRGIGLRSVQSAVSIYDGTMDVETKDGSFNVTILLYNQTNSNALMEL